MLAGCSSTLLSPRHRLRSESSRFQACHFPSMSTQRLDLPHSFTRNDTTSRPLSITRPVSISIEKPTESKPSSRSLKQSIKLPQTPTTDIGRGDKRDGFWERNRSLKKKKKKRYADAVLSDDESCTSRIKRTKRIEDFDDLPKEEGNLSLSHLGSDSLWIDICRSVPLITQLNGTANSPFSTTCLGDQEKAYFLPSDPITPALPPLANVPWYDSVVTQITDLGKAKVETGQGLAKEASGSGSSSTSSETRGLVLRLSENPVERETGDGSSQHNPIRTSVLGRNSNHEEEYESFELISLLVTCVEQIGSKNVSSVSHCLSRLGELSSPKGPTPIHRLVAYFTEALALRVAKLWPQVFHITIPSALDRSDQEDSLRLLNQVSPIPKFIHFTLNEILLRAFEGKERVHIIDFNTKQGLQWPSLFQSLASRANPPSHVRITGIGESKIELSETGDGLARLAESFNLSFAFHPVVDRLEDVRLWMLHVKENETIAINCMFQMHKLLYDSSRSTLRNFLGLIHSTNPEIIVMAEQEAAHNEPSLDSRITSSLKYYSAMFDSIDSCLSPDSSVRIKIEEMFAREIRNIIACEGRDRFERHETFEKWRDLMGQGGFKNIGLSERELLQGQVLLRMYDETENFRVEKKQDGESLSIKWLDQPLYTVSAWSRVDVAGSSSSPYPRKS